MAYDNMSKYIKNVVHPYIVNLRDMLKSNVDWIREKFNIVDQDMADTNAHIDSVEQDLSNEIQNVEAKHDAHASRRNNPHVVKLTQTATVSSLPPTNVQGRTGDAWIQTLD
jgi:hypothetical protein